MFLPEQSICKENEYLPATSSFAKLFPGNLKGFHLFDIEGILINLQNG
jgi:hypothetical protein